MANLEFFKDEQVDTHNIAMGMYSKESEYVPFQTHCSCDGPVRTDSASKSLNLHFFHNIVNWKTFLSI